MIPQFSFVTEISTQNLHEAHGSTQQSQHPLLPKVLHEPLGYFVCSIILTHLLNHQKHRLVSLHLLHQGLTQGFTNCHHFRLDGSGVRGRVRIGREGKREGGEGGSPHGGSTHTVTQILQHFSLSLSLSRGTERRQIPTMTSTFS